MMKAIFSFLLVVLSGLHFYNAYAADGLQVLTPDHEARITYQLIDEGKLLVSVRDAEENPIRGLQPKNFVVKSGIKTAKILSAEPLETSQEVPLNIVLVVDNSSSMKRRRAVKPLLSALDAFFETLRPIDNIHGVVFSSKETMKVKEYTLNTRTFHSSEISDLRDFFNEVFDRGLTSGTYLYDAMVAGIDLIRKMPEKDQKFLVVFSDGDDINSSVTKTVVSSEAVGIPNFEAFCIDYMPGSKEDRFLESFAETHGGHLWKAKSAKQFIPIFQSFTTTLLYRYVVSYRVLDPPRGTVTIEPAELNFDVLTMIGGAPVMNKVFFDTGKSEIPESYVLFTDRAQAESFDEKRLATALDRYHNVLNLVGKKLTENPSARIRIVGCNSDTGVEKNNLELSEARAEAVKDYLFEVWGIDTHRMELEARNLPVNPTPMIVVGSRPENQRVEVIFDSTEMEADSEKEFFVETSDANEIRITSEIVAEYGIANWELTLLADNREIKTLKGTDDLKPSYAFFLGEIGLERLAAYGNLEAHIKVTDIYDDTHEAATDSCPIRVSKKELVHELVGPPSGSVAMEPETLTIEELTTIDSSPLLNYMFFETGESEIPERYTLFTNQADTETFDESNLRGTLEKHHHILNIIGKRVVANPDAHIKIVGCNSNRGVEYGKTDLSRSWAEAVRAYLRYIWGIASSRMEVEARNLPAVASASSVEEGRAENQRVEIYSDRPEIVDTIKSTYVEAISDAHEFRILPQIQAGYDLSHWTIQLTGDGTQIGSLEGTGDLLPAYTFEFQNVGLRKIGSYANIQADIEVVDKKGQIYNTAARSSVRFIKREERRAQKMGYKVVEKYALILFDFDSADIKDRNKVVVDRILDRIKEVPNAVVTVVGHTDTIGKVEYNLDLSKRRAKAAYDQISAGGATESWRIIYEGSGPYNPLYDNGLPEGRALNRTVTVTLKYVETE